MSHKTEEVVKTKKTTLTLQLNGHMLDAIRMNTPPGKPSLEDELYALIDKVYKRYVSKDVRDFIAQLDRPEKPRKKADIPDSSINEK